MANEITLQESGTASVLAVIERAATNPDVDVDKMEKLLSMHERMQERQASAAFTEAFSDMQDELPAIEKRGNAAGRYTFAKWEDINEVVKPILKKHGFTLSFRMDTINGISVTGVLSHKAGHSEQTTITLQPDTSGNKNAVQSVASSVQYGKRYAAGALLNLTSYGEDDDGFAGSTANQQWHEAIDGADDKTALADVKKRIVSAFGMPDKVPANLRHACIKRAKELAA